MSFFMQHKGNNIWWGEFSAFSEDVVAHGVSSRLGGVSKAPYNALNMALHVGDDREAVLKNRALALGSLGLEADKLVTPEQVHGDNVVAVTGEDAGRGAKDYDDAIKATDALITNRPGLPIMLCFADCVPVMLVDPEKRAIGLAHGGWKGTLLGIAQKTVAAMTREFGTDPADCLAGIGPSIGAGCFSVGDDVAGKFREKFPQTVQGEAGSYRVDLWEANRLDLEAAGLLPENIDVAGVCTCCQPKWFFSYRQSGGVTGRIAAVLALKW